MFQKFILLFCVLLVYTVNTEEHEYVVIADYPYHVRETHFFFYICASLQYWQIKLYAIHVALIGSQYSTVSIQIAERHVCSGAFIHESWIMTVASCVFKAKSSMVSVRVRSSYISMDGDVLEVDSIVVHENFDKYVYFNDIALMKLKSPAEFGEKLLPIGLPEKENEEFRDGTHCVVTGWKRTRGTSTSRAQLAAAAVTIVNQRTCEATMPSYKPLSKDMLCAGNVTRSEPCQGDPGAPLVSAQMLIGILSYGLGCETRIHPGVYTRVSSYLPWIFINTGISYK